VPPSPRAVPALQLAPFALFFVLSALLLSCAETFVDYDPPRLARDPIAPAPPAHPTETAPPTPAGPAASPRLLASCGESEAGFPGWIEAFRQHAIAQGISSRTVAASLAGATYDPAVIELDRSQKAFHLTFEQFAARHATRALIARGQRKLREHRPLLAKIEERFGVAPEIIVAIWGLETDFGENTGSMSALRSLATLAYDCRRAERFRGELLSALRLVERGDLAPQDMLGAWAGELGQTQFLPSSYERFAIDFDGDGRADLINSSADALASTARYLQGNGWRPREGFRPGTPNFTALESWNKSEIYRKTIALLAGKIAAPGGQKRR
jgi:membrane-bound lytic murein transglycosylase B